jgi:hypothetical protein
MLTDTITEQRRCKHCLKPLPEDSPPGKEFCNRTHREGFRQRSRDRTKRLRGCEEKLYYFTIEEAIHSGNLQPGIALRRCRYCDGYHATRNIKGKYIVLVRISWKNDKVVR